MSGYRRRRGISAGTVLMLFMTGLVVLGCALLFPKLRGTVDVTVDASDIAVVIEDPMASVAAERQPAPANQPNATPDTVPLITQAPPAANVEAYTSKTYTFQMTVGGTLNFSTAIQKSVLADDVYDYGSIFERIENKLAGDINLFTLENTVVDTQKLSDTNLDTSVLSALRASGVSALCVGTADILNYGTSGTEDTMRLITANGMTPYGIYPTAESAKKATILNINGVSVALLSFRSEITSQGKKRTTAEEREHAYYLPNIENITARIQQARSQGAQIVIVSLYWGKPNATSPTDAQRTLAQQVADAGADIILGTHSDAVQTVEILSSVGKNGEPRETLCAYSLGSTLSANRDRRTQLAGMLLHLTLTYHAADERLTFDQLTCTPTYIWRYRVSGEARYRILPSNQAAPDEMDENQRSVMERCLQLVQEALTGSPVALVE